MKNPFVVLSSLVMIAYVACRGFTTFAILPFTEPLLSPGGAYFLLLVLLAAAATVLSFTRRKGLAASLAAVVGLVALGSWFRDIVVAPVWTRSNLIWFVLPEVCFSLAGLCKWWVGRSRALPKATPPTASEGG
jgi:hypothetical protein